MRTQTRRQKDLDVEESKRDLVSTRISYVLYTSFSFWVRCTIANCIPRRPRNGTTDLMTVQALNDKENVPQECVGTHAGKHQRAKDYGPSSSHQVVSSKQYIKISSE